MSFDGIVFDFDYTIASLGLLDFIVQPNAISPFVHMREACDRYRGIRSLSLRTMIHASLKKDTDARLFDKYSRRLYRPQHVHKIIHQLIRACDEKNIPRAVLSDHPCIEKLQSIGLEKGWSAVVHCQNYGALKPLPDALHAVMAQMGVPASRLVLIGDRWDSDGLMASSAGAHFVHIDHTNDLLQRIRNRE